MRVVVGEIRQVERVCVMGKGIADSAPLLSSRALTLNVLLVCRGDAACGALCARRTDVNIGISAGRGAAARSGNLHALEHGRARGHFRVRQPLVRQRRRWLLGGGQNLHCSPRTSFYLAQVGPFPPLTETRVDHSSEGASLL